MLKRILNAITVNFLRRTRIPNSILCNWCGNESEDVWDLRPNMKFEHTFMIHTPKGYSEYDGKKIKIRLCNACSNEFVKMIRAECVIDPMKESGLL